MTTFRFVQTKRAQYLMRETDGQPPEIVMSRRAGGTMFSPSLVRAAKRLASDIESEGGEAQIVEVRR